MNTDFIPRNSLIISCQAEGDDPFNTPLGVSLFAKAAELGGAAAIRSEGVEKTRMILNTVTIPVIGLVKGRFENGMVCITRNSDEVGQLIDIGCKIIAIDGTNRKVNGLTGPEFIRKVKSQYNCKVIADISALKEAKESHEAGADFMATTLSGYTNPQKSEFLHQPDFELVSELYKHLPGPIIAEGRICNSEQVNKMLSLGAWSVVIGTAITRPRTVVNNIVNQINKYYGN